jgi:hypothetical protein
LPETRIDVSGLTELMAAVLDVCDSLSPGSFLWFRGLKRPEYKLIPTLLRDNRRSDEIFDREKRLLTRFRQRSLPFWGQGYFQSDWEILFAMQHYGIPTRLLDWTENLFIAVYFALIDENSDPNTRIICCIDPIEWNRNTPVLSEFGNSIHVLTTSDAEIDSYRPDTTKKRYKSPIAIFGTHNSERIVAQRGTFMIWGEDTKELEAFSAESKAVIRKFVLKGDRNGLLSQLNALGFAETMAFPELSSLAIELSRVEGWRDYAE